MDRTTRECNGSGLGATWDDEPARYSLQRCTPVSSELTTEKTLILGSIEHSRTALSEEIWYAIGGIVKIEALRNTIVGGKKHGMMQVVEETFIGTRILACRENASRWLN